MLPSTAFTLLATATAASALSASEISPGFDTGVSFSLSPFLLLFPRGPHRCKAIKRIECLGASPAPQSCPIPLAHDEGHLGARYCLAHVTVRQDPELTVPQIFPDTTYPDAVNPLAESGAKFMQTSPPFYPSPWMKPEVLGWADAYVKAKDFVSQLTLAEKVNLTTGVG
jgi:hypothetical protein